MTFNEPDIIVLRIEKIDEEITAIRAANRALRETIARLSGELEALRRVQGIFETLTTKVFGEVKP